MSSGAGGESRRFLVKEAGYDMNLMPCCARSAALPLS